MQLKIDEIFAEKVIPANDSVRLLDQIVEGMNKAPLERALKRSGRGHRTNPIAMLKVILYSAMEHKHASRAIGEACVRDINCIWLPDGEPAPNYRAICRFRSEENLISERGWACPCFADGFFSDCQLFSTILCFSTCAEGLCEIFVSSQPLFM